MGPKGVRVSLVEPGIVLSGFQTVAGYSDEMVHSFPEKFGLLLTGADVANAIHFIVTQPPHVPGLSITSPATKKLPGRFMSISGLLPSKCLQTWRYPQKNLS